MPNELGGATQDWSAGWSKSRRHARDALRASPVLEQVVRRDVVQSLFIAHHPINPRIEVGSLQRAWAAEAAALVQVLPMLDLDAGARALRSLNPGGRRFEAVCHDILLPAAAQLRLARDGEGADEVGYLMGLWRLRMLLTGLDDDGRVTAARPRGGAAALLVAGGSLAPTLEHAMVLRFFQRAGWSVCCCGQEAEEDPCAVASRDRFELAWFSVDDGTDLHALSRTVTAVRDASRNRAMRVLSGWLVEAPPPSPATFGADAMTRDATVAASLAHQVLAPVQ